MMQTDNLLRSSDPSKLTCRSKLQAKRSKLNQQINKEMMLRAGAENLYRATNNKKLRETVVLELSFVNSNLQLLKEELSELNCNVSVYQGESKNPEMPMIPLGLKETKGIDMRTVFKEDPKNYDNAIENFMNLRQKIRTPTRDTAGIALLFKYLNQLYYVERRFFAPFHSLGIFFEWYDSLTGIPSCQRSIAFEKASILFNIGALYSQIGARKNKNCEKSLQNAKDSFLRAAGMFRYITENYANAPSMDLQPDVLNVLVQLMLIQARECLFLKLILSSNQHPECHLELAQEASQVSSEYSHLQNSAAQLEIADYLPNAWRAMMHVKKEHYAGKSHQEVSFSLSNIQWPLTSKLKEILQLLPVKPTPTRGAYMDIVVPCTVHELQLLGKSHLRTAVLCHEEALRLNRLCRLLRKQNILQELLKQIYEETLTQYSSMDQEDEFQILLDALPVSPFSKHQLMPIPPDFGLCFNDDPFHALGPLSVFSARRQWSESCLVCLDRLKDEDFGFSIKGDAPVIITSVDSGSIAELRGVKEGNVIVEVASVSTKWATHEQVVQLIRNQGDHLQMRLITVLPDTQQSSVENGVYPEQPSQLIRNRLKKYIIASTTSSSSSSGVSSLFSSNKQHTKSRSTWNLFKRSKEKYKSLLNIKEGSYVTSTVFS